MNNRELKSTLRRIKNGINSQAIVDKLEAQVLGCDTLTPVEINAAKLLLQGAGFFDETDNAHSGRTIINVQYGDIIQAPGNEALAAPVSEQQPALEHRSDPSQGGKDVSGDLLAADAGADVPTPES